MRTLILVVIIIASSILFAAEPIVSDITAKQRYPWNGLVDITCKVSGIEGKRKFVLSAVMPDSGKVVGLNNFWVVRNGEKSTNFEVSANGDYRLLWDAKADLGEVRYDNMVVRITLDDIHDKVQLWEGGPYWATTNIGAEKPEDYGYYFWWGDTVGYKWENDMWVASDGSNSSFSFTPSNTPTFNKSKSTLQGEGWITADAVLVPEHDAARKHWGGYWRMPTKQEFDDLNSKCDWTWTTMNGVNGYVVRGRGNYASVHIFLPCAGTGLESSLNYAGGDGYYWSSVRYLPGDCYAVEFRINHREHFTYYYYCDDGRSVRSVQNAVTAIVDCTDDSRSFLLNTIEVPLNISPIAYNSSWVGADENATITIIITDNGVEVFRGSGEGDFVYSPTTPGKHTLTYTTYIDDVAQSEVYSATIFADWKYTVEDGKATIVETTHTSGDVIIPSEIDGFSVVGFRDDLFAGCTSLKSIVIPESVTNVVVESKSLMDVDGAVAAYEFKGTLDDGTGYAPSGNGSFAADRFGIANSAYYFNGQEQRFVNTQKIVEGTFSFAFWFRTDVEMSSIGSSDKSGNGDGNYILFPKHGGVKRGYGAMVGTDGIKVMAHGDSYIAPVITYSNSIGSGWNHAVVTVSDNTNVKLYLNGEYVATGTGPSATAIFRVDAGGNYGFYTGYLDDLVVCDRALDDAGVKELYSWTAASFAGCNGIVDVTMPGGLAESMAEMFPDSYASITNVVLTGGVAQIPAAAFSGCGALESVTLAESGATLALGGDKGWRFDEGGVLRSGKITHNESSFMSMTVQGEGRLTYRWKASSEYYKTFISDYAYLVVDGVAKGTCESFVLGGAAIGGATDWQEVSIDIENESAHQIDWIFVKNDNDAGTVGEDCVWVDAIAYEPFIKVSFDIAGAEGTIPAFIKDVPGASVTLPTSEGFAKAKHTLTGWRDGVQTYEPGSEYQIGATNVVLAAVYSPNTLAVPVISSDDVVSGGEITSASATVEISAEDGTIVYYTLDGTDPTSESLLYGGAFEAEDLGLVTVKAIAVRENCFDSEVAEFSFTRRPYSAAECLNANGMTFTLGGDVEWSRVLDGDAHDGDAAMRSGAITDNQACFIETKVSGAGTISFWWKSSCEVIFNGMKFDYASFAVDGIERECLAGVGEWTNVSVEIAGSGEHTLRWVYQKDSSDKAGEDCAWLDEVVWTPVPDPIPELAATATATEVSAALEGSADAKLAANITDAAEYAAYRTWALGLAGVTAQEVKDSAYAWLSYALNTATLIGTAPKEGDVVIDTFESSATDGAFEFIVKIDGIEVGDNALEANIKKVFDIEGVEKIGSGGVGFSSDNVEFNAALPVNGNVKFTVTPKMEKDQMPESFFFRVKMK